MGRTDDPAEHEAERVANQMTNMSAGHARRCACGGVTEHGGECAACRARRVRLERRAPSAQPAGVAPPIVNQVIASPGRPLSSEIRTFFEPRLGLDLAAVRVHDDPKAAQSARAVGADAYTVGDHIAFASGRHDPSTDAGKRLLAHELVHVAEQRGASAQPMLRRDLARPPRAPGAAVPELTPEELTAAISFNERRFTDPYSIRVIRDVVGVSPLPAVVDEEMVRAVVDWQAARKETPDGKIGHVTTRSLVLELIAERQLRDAVILIVDSYGLLTTLALNDIRVGIGVQCCGQTGHADAVTSGGVCPPIGAPVRVCVCRTRFPPVNNYDHFVRIVGHEMIHVPHCATAPVLNLNATEFDAWFFEACGGGRAPMLSPIERVNHANRALGFFAALAPADQTPGRVAMRNQLNALVARGGLGPC